MDAHTRNSRPPVSPRALPPANRPERYRRPKHSSWPARSYRHHETEKWRLPLLLTGSRHAAFAGEAGRRGKEALDPRYPHGHAQVAPIERRGIVAHLPEVSQLPRKPTRP